MHLLRPVSPIFTSTSYFTSYNMRDCVILQDQNIFERIDESSPLTKYVNFLPESPAANTLEEKNCHFGYLCLLVLLFHFRLGFY